MSLVRRVRLPIAVALALSAAAACTVLSLATAPPAAASSGQLAMFQDQVINTNPVRTLQILRSLGVGIIRLDLSWKTVAPDATSQTEPGGFDPTNPAAYPSANWAQYDTVIQDARADGIQVDLLVDGGAPLWAAGSGAPSGFGSVYKPSAAQYGQFVKAVGTRYSGSYTPPGASSPLPRISFWELWNEGNWSPALSPQVPTAGSGTYVAAAENRSLIDAAWPALQQTGHGSDTIIYGSLSPDQSQLVVPVSATSASPPIAFVRTLYCLNASYRPLQGTAARAVGCPGSKYGFVAQNPALFKASGIGVHPYGYGNPPNRAEFPNPNSVEFAEIPQLQRDLTRMLRAYGSRRPLGIYNTEYGYEPRPPQRSRMFVKPTTAAAYINWAEYLSYKNRGVATYDQYKLYDGSDWFTTGLINRSNKLLPSFYAYRMPIWLPVTSTRRGRSLEVWGCIRPANNARIDTGKAQYAYVQFARGRSGRFTNFKRVRVVNSRGYIDLRIKFPSSGHVRLAWEYPSGDSKLADPLTPGHAWIYSRAMSVTLR
jgi:hypothetical protein